MKLNTSNKRKSKSTGSGRTERITRIIALVIAFASAYFFLIKILFL